MYRITYKIGNGYYCGCCRCESSHTIDFKDTDKMFEWIANNINDTICKIDEDEDLSDFCITKIEIGLGVDMKTEIMKAAQPMIDRERSRRELIIAEQNQKLLIEKQNKEKELLVKLIEKYGLPDNYKG